MSAIDLAARLAGVPQDTIDSVKTSMPHLARLVQTFKDHEALVLEGKALADKYGPILAEVQPLIAPTLAFYAKLSPLIAPAMAEFDAVLPAVQKAIAFAQAEQQPSEPASRPETGG